MNNATLTLDAPDTASWFDLAPVQDEIEAPARNVAPAVSPFRAQRRSRSPIDVAFTCLSVLMVASLFTGIAMQVWSMV